MSRAGKNPIAVPSGVQVAVNGREVSVKGKLGALSYSVTPEVDVALAEGRVTVTPRDGTKRSRSMWGTTQRRLRNMVRDVQDGFRVNLEINGVGYRAQTDGKALTLQLGHSHDMVVPIPASIKVTCERPTAISLVGPDRVEVGQLAANIRGYRPPEPYKGKGIKYETEVIQRKEGKKK
ncbi:MAG: 50S ribosomal protein L6 [Alphaproteobacteria bacterium]|nr:50S ribosomal protein L6 [Alphaproteobacteria bacterium]